MMTRLKEMATILIAAAMFSGPAFAQNTSADGGTAPAATRHKAKHKEHRETGSERQLREMKEQMAQQQSEIDALKSQLAGQKNLKDQQVTTAQQSAADAQSQAATAAAAAAAANSAAAQASSSAAENSTRIDAVSSSVNDLKTTTSAVAATQARTQEEIEHPAALHYKGVTFTPVAFMAFEGVYRQHSVNSDINTPFNTIPLPSANEGHVSELNFSGRQSRLGLFINGDAGAYRLSGYYEMDFLGAGVTSNNNQSNSYVLRQRQIWGRAETQGGFAVTGGQMWSLVTEDGLGTDNRTEKLPDTIDAQYMVGFNWTRQPAIRLQQRFGDYKTGAFTIAASAEQAQITNFTATSATTGAVPTNFYFAGAGQNGGLYNAYNGTYANNVAPDFLVKAAFDIPMMHVEFGGIARFMRDYYYPILTAASGTSGVTYTYSPTSVSNTATAGGAFGSIRVSPSKYLDVAVQAMGGTGVGRYGSSQLADATLKPSGALEPIRNYHGLFSLETHPTRKLDVFAYYGGEYDQRTVYTTATGALEGYGPTNLSDAGCYNLPANPGSSTGGSPSAAGCASPTRYIQEPMVGFIYRVVDSPKYGRLQYWATYSYLQRNLWSGIGSATTPSGPRATDPMVHVSMRYYIP